MRYDNRICVWRCLIVLGLAAGWSGCHKVPELTRWYLNPYHQPRTVAVTVFINQSGSQTFDPVAMTDEFYTELQQIDQFNVVPVSRVLAAMNALNRETIASPGEAMELADALNADLVIVGAVTRYDPFFKPSIGIILQLYDRKRALAQRNEDVSPTAFEQQPKTFFPEPQLAERPIATVVRIIDCDQKETVDRLEDYADDRTGEKRPDGWKFYTRGRNFLRFASYEMIGELLAQEKARLEKSSPESMNPSLHTTTSGDDI